MPTPYPPLVDGVTSPATAQQRAELAHHLASWALVGYAHAARDGGRGVPARALAGLFWVVGSLIWPIVKVVARRTAHDPSRRFYATPDAILGVRVTPDGWHIEDHVSRTPGEGHGKRLRQLVVPTPLAYADEHHIALHLTTRSPKLAAAFQAEAPGLHQVGHRSPFGLIHLQREILCGLCGEPFAAAEGDPA